MTEPRRWALHFTDDTEPDHVAVALDAIVDKVLAYRPKAKSKPAKKRQRRRKKLQKAT